MVVVIVVVVVVVVAPPTPSRPRAFVTLASKLT